MMLYDIVMTTLLVSATVGGIWASRQMSKAAKEGKLCVIGKVRIGMDDSDRIDWLAANHSRLQDVYWRLENEEGTLRDAIDFFVRIDESARHTQLDS
jgi:hypothetical protein